MAHVHGNASRCNYLARTPHPPEDGRGTATVLQTQESPPSSNNSLFLWQSGQESSGNRFSGMDNMENFLAFNFMLQLYPLHVRCCGLDELERGSQLNSPCCAVLSVSSAPSRSRTVDFV
jgi:hypothetical protein